MAHTCYTRCRDNEKGGRDVIDPFNDITPFAERENMGLPLSPMSPRSFTSQRPPTKSSKETEEEINVGEDIAEGSNEKLFDAVEKSIKYLVFTNTWRKMIGARKGGDPRTSEETLT